MIWYDRDILSEIIKFLGVKEICTMKLVNKFIFNEITIYTNNNAKKLFKEIITTNTMYKKIEYYSTEIIYTKHSYNSGKKILQYIEKYKDTLLIIFIYGVYSSKKNNFNINFILNKLRFINTGYLRISFGCNSLPNIKYISGNININELCIPELFTYNNKYNEQNRSEYVNKYINNNTIWVGIFNSIFIKQITDTINRCPNLKKLVININITNGFVNIPTRIIFPNIIKITIYNEIRYYPNKYAFVFRQIFPNARIKIVDVFLNITRRF